MWIAGFEFLPFDGACKCTLEQKLPTDVLVYRMKDCALYAVPSEIGKDAHPLIYFFEAATYKDGAWLVGIDHTQNRYFTPVFKQK